MSKKISELVCYNTDNSGMFGEASGVLFPESIKQVKDAVFNNQDIVIRGLGSSVVGGCVPSNSVVIDMKGMNSINFDTNSEMVQVGAGVTVRELNERLKALGYEFPVFGDGTIGGMIAINQPSIMGGYGRINNWVEEVEFVNGRGELVKLGRSDIGDVLGMEGVTGIITGAKLKVIKRIQRSISVFQTAIFDEALVAIKRVKLEKSAVMIRFYSPYFSKILGFPERYHVIVGFNNSDGKIVGRDYDKLFQKIRKDHYAIYSRGYREVDDSVVSFEKIGELLMILNKFNVPYSSDLNLGIVFSYFNDDLKKKEVLKIINRLGGKPGRYGIGIKRKDLVDEIQKKIIKRVKLRHDPFLKMNRGKLVNLDNPGQSDEIGLKDKNFLKEDSDVGGSSFKNRDIVDDKKLDKGLIDKILFNKGDEDGKN